MAKVQYERHDIPQHVEEHHDMAHHYAEEMPHVEFEHEAHSGPVHHPFGYDHHTDYRHYEPVLDHHQYYEEAAHHYY